MPAATARLERQPTAGVTNPSAHARVPFSGQRQGVGHRNVGGREFLAGKIGRARKRLFHFDDNLRQSFQRL
jgi:hypothetical protein